MRVKVLAFHGQVQNTMTSASSLCNRSGAGVIIATFRSEYEYDFSNLTGLTPIYWSATERSEGSGNETDLKFESRTRSQCRTRTPIVAIYM